MRVTTVFCFLVGTGLAGPATARGQSVPQPVCLDTAVTQPDMNSCAARLYQWSDERLLRLLAALRDTSRTEGFSSIAEAQSAWQSFRDAQCGWVREQYDGGSMAPMAHSLCLADLTERRIDELKGYLCGLGGGSCPASRLYDLKEGSQ